MKYAEYTPDTVCNAMGLPAFRDEASLNGMGPSMRLLLEPSFHPEVCITMKRAESTSVVEVRALGSSLWQWNAPAPLPTAFTEQFAVGSDKMEAFAAAFLQVADSMQQEGIGKWTTLDGMPAAVVLRSSGHLRELEGNVSGHAVFGQFVATVLEWVHGNLPGGVCRNAVVAAGAYVDLHLPVEPMPAQSAVVRVVMLGDEEGKREVVDRLNREQPRRRNASRGS